MRHQKSGRALSRTTAHREAMFSNMAASLIKHGLIRTTLPKAKELRRVAEPLITLAKVDGVANRRLAFSRLRDKEAVGTLFTTLARVTRRARAATCASSSAVSALATMRRWPTSNWSTVPKLRSNPRSLQSGVSVGSRKLRPLPGLSSFLASEFAPFARRIGTWNHGCCLCTHPASR